MTMEGLHINQQTLFVFTSIIITCYFYGAVYCETHVPNRKLQGHVLQVHYGVSYKECTDQCDRSAECLSINYARKYHLCELNTAKATPPSLTTAVKTGDQLIETMGSVYKEKDLSNDVCTRSKCPVGDVCEVEGTCQITQCSYILSVTNGTVSGNMAEVRAARLVVCSPEYKLVLGDTLTICTEGGVWGQTSTIRCEKVCPQPLAVTGSIMATSNIVTAYGNYTYSHDKLTNLSDVDVLETSTITYQCDSNRLLVGSSIITCMDGSWTQTPTCKFTYLEGCSGNHECAEPGLHCSDWRCVCNEQYSYTYSGHECVHKCPNGMANTFQKISDKTVFSLNADTSGFLSFDECRNKCIHDGNCKGFNFGIILDVSECSLMSHYAVDSYFVSLVTHDYYQRDCA